MEPGHGGAGRTRSLALIDQCHSVRVTYKPFWVLEMIAGELSIHHGCSAWLDPLFYPTLPKPHTSPYAIILQKNDHSSQSAGHPTHLPRNSTSSSLRSWTLQPHPAPLASQYPRQISITHYYFPLDQRQIQRGKAFSPSQNWCTTVRKVSPSRIRSQPQPPYTMISIHGSPQDERFTYLSALALVLFSEIARISRRVNPCASICSCDCPQLATPGLCHPATRVPIRAAALTRGHTTHS